MGRQKNGDRRRSGQGWLSTLVGILVLTAGGFLIGLVVGVISEEPELVARLEARLLAQRTANRTRPD